MIRRARPRSIRWRLTAATVIVATAVLGLLAAVTGAQLRAAASSSATELAYDDLRPYVADLRMQPDEQPDLPSEGLLILVVDPAGAPRRDSMPAGLARAARSVAGEAEIRVGSDEFRVVSRTVTTRDGTWHLWAARDLTPDDALLAGVMLTVLIGTPLAVLLLACTAWVVSSAALRPVATMRATAERLRAATSTESLPSASSTELAELASTLNGLITELRASAAHERRVTADAAHELRTPLAVLAAQIELAERDPHHADLGSIRRSVERMTTLADTLLALSRADSTAPEQRAESSVSDLVTEAMDVIDRCRMLAPSHVLVDLELEPGLDERRAAAIDEAGFGRVLTNLVGNALAAGPASTVTVRLRSVERAMQLEVEDDGPGVPAEFLPFAFDRFSRPDGPRGDGSAGSGLGLALVKALVDRSGGSVTLHNRHGRGAIAVATIPFA